ncbi:MAG: hypothetical protein JW754_04875 [Candidatus Aenigmarchaeota archaeon]|nr:hypothetical protein [Candidatus Aenigmarchaeota archaeon]
MASVHFIDVKDGEIYVNLKLSKKEYKILGQETDNLIVLPTSNRVLDHELTTGKLGNSNRLMLPKKMLIKERVMVLEKRVRGNLFDINNDVFLLVKIKESMVGIPRFIEVKK